MIRDWDEIISRFDAIKDHKPKAAKKLNELGDILASAYKINAVEADSMWQYLVDLNVADTPENAKFYIAQVFNKLTDRLAPEEATELLAMTPERVQLMVLYGYDGGTMWHCLSTLIKGFIKLGTVENCMVTVDFYFDKMDRLNPGHEQSLSVVTSSVRYANELYKEEAQYRDAVIEFMHQLLEIDNDRINAYVRIAMVTLGYEECEDSDELIDLANEYKFASEFIELLWNYRETMSAEEFTARWVAYLDELDEEHHHVPTPSFQEENERLRNTYHSDKSYYEGTKMEFFVSMMKDNDDILPHYFNSASNLCDYIIYSWISEGDWERFTRYVAQMLVNTHEERYEYSQVKRLLDCYLDAYFYDDYRDSTDEYGRSNKIVTKDNLADLEAALSSISAITVGCPLHDEFHETIKEFMQKASGNLDALNEAGFDDQIDERNPEQRLKDYVCKFLQSGELEHDNSNGEYRRICDAIREEVNASYDHNQTHHITIDISGLVKKALFEKLVKAGTLSEDDREKFFEDDDTGAKVTSDEDEEKKIDYRLERDYLHALDDDIAEFYFLHCKHDSHEKSDMLTACIKKNDIARAVELVDLLLKTTSYEDFSAHNSWAFDMKRVAELLAENFTRDGRYSWRNDDVTDEQVQTAYQLIEKIIPHILAEDVESVRIELMKMMPETADNDAYIRDLMQDVEIYTTFPKPRGKGNAMNINRMSAKIMDSFEILARMGRLDVVSQILSRFAAVKDVLAPVAFSTWMHSISRGLSSEDFYKVYKMNKPAFEAWLETNLRDHDIIRVAEELGESCTHAEFMEFRNMVVSRHGSVDGLDSCFKFTSENTETQLMYDGDTIQLKLDYIEVHHNSTYAEIHLLSTAKADEVDSVRVVKCEVNGIPVEDYGSWTDFDDDDGPDVGFSVYGDDEDDNQISIYSDFFEKNKITEIDSIVLQFTVYDEDVEEIETITEIVIKHDSESGLYRVIKQGENIQTNIIVDSSDDEDEDDDGDDEITLNLFDNDDDEDEDEEDDEDEFEDVTFYEENDIKIEFCGVEFYSDSLTLKFWVDSDRDEDNTLYAKQLKINGSLVETFKHIGSISSCDCDYLELELDDFGDEDISDVRTIEFSVEIDDEDNDGLFDTPSVLICCDTDEETFSFKINSSNTQVKEDDDDDEIDDEDNSEGAQEEFEDITFYDENDFRIDFCGMIFEDETLALKLWVNSSRDEVIKLFAKDVTLNGVHREDFSHFATVQPNDYGYCRLTVSEDFGEDYEDITSIDLSIELDDDSCNGLYETPVLHIKCDTDEESFSINIPGVGSYGCSTEPTQTDNNLSNILKNSDGAVEQQEIDSFNKLFEAYKDMLDE